jgi:GGDEF domain-containing protein
VPRCVRERDLVALPGGDEFVVVLTDLLAHADRGMYAAKGARNGSLR